MACFGYIADTMYYRNQNPPMMLTAKLSELLDPAPPVPQKTQEEIINNLINNGVTIE